MPEQLEPKKPPKSQVLHARADAARAGLALRLRSPRRLRAGDGRRRRLRPLGVQPRHAGVPPAGLGATSRSTTRWRSTAATPTTRCGTTSSRPRSIRPRASCGSRRTSTAATTRQVSLERALVWSKNPPSVEIFHILGTKDVEKWSHRLGITTPLVTNPKCDKEFCSSLALGASCVHIDEMTRAFAVFARNGKPIEPVMVRRVIDRDRARRRRQRGVGRSRGSTATRASTASRRRWASSRSR